MNPLEFMRLKPRISHNPPVDSFELKARLDLKTQQKRPYFIVASVEVGNTTTKCILMAVNMDDGKSSLVNKTVKMTRDVRAPREGEEVFGHTLNSVPLTREAVAELVRDTLLEAHRAINLDIKKDLNFVVRSTGVVAGFRTPEEVGNIIKALAEGCLLAGVPPKAMTPAMSIDSIPDAFKPYTLIEKVAFNGAVGGVFPPKGATGVELVANEMEGELATAGIKEGAKWAGVDFRNPVLSLDFGTTLDGRITNADLPYAKTIGNFCGLAGAIPDAIVRGTKLVDEKVGAALDIIDEKPAGMLTWMRKSKVIQEYTEKIHRHITIETVPENRDHYGTVPVNPQAAKTLKVTLIGCDVGTNGSDLPKLAEIGRKIHEKHDLKTLSAILDMSMAKVVQRLVKVALDNNLISEETAIGVTGRAGITGNKPKLILKYIDELNIYNKAEENVVFVDDGLARGAAVMARCMNSLGTPKTPLGGRRGGGCVLGARIKYEKQQRTAQS
jgi:putative methanogenesis marker protein 14